MIILRQQQQQSKRFLVACCFLPRYSIKKNVSCSNNNTKILYCSTNAVVASSFVRRSLSTTTFISSLSLPFQNQKQLKNQLSNTNNTICSSRRMIHLKQLLQLYPKLLLFPQYQHQQLSHHQQQQYYYYSTSNHILKNSSSSSNWDNETVITNPYRVLGIPPTSSFEMVQKTFLKLALEHHPDTSSSQSQPQSQSSGNNNNNNNNSSETFIRIRQAFEIIRNQTLLETKFNNNEWDANNNNNNNSFALIQWTENDFLEWFYEQTGIKLDSNQRRELVELYRNRMKTSSNIQELHHVPSSWELARRLVQEQDAFLKKQQQLYMQQQQQKGGGGGQRRRTSNATTATTKTTMDPPPPKRDRNSTVNLRRKRNR